MNFEILSMSINSVSDSIKFILLTFYAESDEWTSMEKFVELGPLSRFINPDYTLTDIFKDIQTILEAENKSHTIKKRGSTHSTHTNLTLQVRASS